MLTLKRGLKAKIAQLGGFRPKGHLKLKEVLRNGKIVDYLSFPDWKY